MSPSRSFRVRAHVAAGAAAACVATSVLLAQAPQTPAPPQLPAGVAPAPAPQWIPAPGPKTDQPYAPQAILPGGVVMPLFAPGSKRLNAARLSEPEVYTMATAVPGRVQSIVNIHNPSIEIHPVDRSSNTGAVVIVAAGGAHNTLNVGTEGADFVPFFYQYGVSTVILRNRLRTSGYDPVTDEVYDALQAVKMVRAHAAEFGFDPRKIGVVGFSAGAELSAPAAIQYEQFDAMMKAEGDALAAIPSRPDFVGMIYPGPSPFTRDPNAAIPRDAPPAFLACAGSGDAQHAVWADQFFAAFLKARIPNVEMHIYGNGVHAGGLKDRADTPFGTWQFRFVDWFRDLGFLGKPGVETKGARDAAEHASAPAGRGRGGE